MPSMRQDGTCRVDFAGWKDGWNPVCSNPSPNEPPRVKIWIKLETPIKSKQEYGFPGGNQERGIIQSIIDLQIHMLERPQLLSSKIKITIGPGKSEGFSQRHVGFYVNYSSFVLRTLRRPAFQKFLQWMLRRERIEAQMVGAVDVSVFPLRRRNGKGLAGNCDTARGKIRIYPKTIRFCREFTQKFGKITLLMYAGSRARAALIHELLHLKYATDEKRVRELAKEYFFAFTRNKPFSSSKLLSIYEMVFRARTNETAMVLDKKTLVPEPIKL